MRRYEPEPIRVPAANHYAFDLKFTPRPERPARVTPSNPRGLTQYVGDLLHR